MREKNNYFRLTDFELPRRYSLPTADFYFDRIEGKKCNIIFLIVAPTSVDINLLDSMSTFAQNFIRPFVKMTFKTIF